MEPSERKTVTEWAREYGINRGTLTWRLKRLTPEQALKHKRRAAYRRWALEKENRP